MTSFYGVIDPIHSMMPVLQGGKLIRFERRHIKVDNIIGFAAPWRLVGV